MKRDIDLIRQMLLFIEESDVPPNSLGVEDFLGANGKAAVIALHLSLLADAGFIEVMKPKNADWEDCTVKRMTFAGYEYLDSIRNDGIWHNVKAKIGELGGVTLDMVKELAVEAAKQHFGLS